MKISNYIMYTAAVVLGILAYYQNGVSGILLGLKGGFKTLLLTLPLILMAMLLAGLIQVLVSDEFVKQWLGKKAGIKGLLLAGIAGALVPGGPYVYFPIAASFFISGAEIGTVLTFIVAKNLWSLSRLPYELALLDTKIVIILHIVTLVFPIILGFLGNILYSKFSPDIRKVILEKNKIRSESE